MSEILKVVIPGNEITKEDLYILDVKLPDHRNFFITGTIFGEDKEPLNNVAVAIYQIDDIDPEKKTLISVTFSYKDGTYGASLPCGHSYVLTVYS